MNRLKIIIKLLSSNLVVILLGVIQALILPKTLEPLEYGIWSSYLLYCNYSGIFSFGFCDGLYLEYGGKEYKKLNFKKLSSYYYSHQLFLLILFSLWSIFTIIFLKNKLFFFCLGLSFFLMCNRDFFLAINTATDRLEIYSKVQPVTKLSLIIGILFCLLFGKISAMSIIYFFIFGWILTMILNCYFSREYIFCLPNLFLPFQEYIKLMNSGIYLTISGISFSVLQEMGKIMINWKMSSIELGLYSFVFSLSGLFIQFFNVLGIFFYPILKKLNQENGELIMLKLEELLSFLGIVLLPLYFPMRIILENIFTKYTDGMDNLLILIPVVLVQGKINIIFMTLYKSYRLEKQLLKNLIIGICITVLLVYLSLIISYNIFIIAVSSYFSLEIWSYISFLQFNGKNLKNIEYFFKRVFPILLFLVINLIFKFSLISLILSCLETLIVLFILKKDIVYLYKELKDYILKRFY